MFPSIARTGHDVAIVCVAFAIDDVDVLSYVSQAPARRAEGEPPCSPWTAGPTRSEGDARVARTACAPTQLPSAR